VVNRASMGHINRAAFPDDPQIVQEFCFVGPQLSDCRTASPSQHMHSAPIFWNGPDGLTLYLWSEWDVAKAYHFNTGTGLFDTTPVSQGTVATNGMPSGILSLSANGSTLGTGIVWGTHTPLPSGDRHGVLQAFDASDLSHILWDSDANPADGVGTVAKFTPPMVVNGKVYMASFNNRLDVYGLLYPYSTLPIRNYRTTKPITLSWNWVDWAAFYEIQVDDNADFGSPLSSVTSPLPASRLSTNVSPGYGTYYWHVRAKRADGYTGPWSATETFTLGR